MVKARMAALEQAYAAVKPEEDYVPPVPEVPPSGAARKAVTAVPLATLHAINAGLLKVPEGFSVHRKLERNRAECSSRKATCRLSRSSNSGEENTTGTRLSHSRWHRGETRSSERHRARDRRSGAHQGRPSGSLPRDSW
jgi:2-oxoglutarate dehydrogenase complex dehydrogenase (E1) component-like enzyme